jgi:hypothetical protein
MPSEIGNDRKSLKTHSSVNLSAREDLPDRFTDFFSRIINSETAGSSQLGGYRAVFKGRRVCRQKTWDLKISGNLEEVDPGVY